MKHRSEIDGLRALAVLPVMVFHASESLLPGGFLGVDIFFVISGFLITRIIVDALDSGSFSVVDFYERRARRILPALALVMLVCTPLAYLLMLPDDLENYGQSLVATAASANNVLLYLTTDYFALETQFKPLMHTWSLGVEEQYYFAIPFIMLLGHRLGGRRLVVLVLAAITVASFGASVILAERDVAANFYLITSRAWELGAGALTTLAAGRLQPLRSHARIAGALATLGIVLMIVPFFVFDERMPLPGWPTLVPVIGTCLILTFAAQDNIAGRVLALRPLVVVGLISYSAYLWHQPVFVSVRIASLDQPSSRLMIALIPLVLVLAWLSWRFVEAPFRDRRRFTRRRIFALSGGTIALAVAAGLSMHLTSGFYSNWPELASGDPEFGTKQNIGFNSGPYKFKDRPLNQTAAEPNLLVIGDSFARDVLNMAEQTNALADKNVSYLEGDDCILPLSQPWRDRIAAADTIIWAIRAMGSPGSLSCVPHRLREFAALTRAPVLVVGTKNFGWNNNAVMLLPPQSRYRYRVRPLDDTIRDNRAAARLVPAGHYIDIVAILSDDRGRVPVFTPDHKFISQDRRHLTKAGARYLGPILFDRPPLNTLRSAD